MNPREACSGESKCATWLSQGSMGPLGKKTDLKSYTHLEYTQGPTCQPAGGRSGPAGPTGVQSNRPWVGLSWPSMLWLPIGLSLCSRGAFGNPQ
jgi:hypothetical protein